MKAILSNLIFIFSFLFIFSNPIWAQPRTSPFEPPEEGDTTFIVDAAPGLDTGCTFRGGGPLIFEIEVKRVVGDVNSAGNIVNANILIENGIISETASLTFPAFDVDYGADLSQYGLNPERDIIKFNGVEINRVGTNEPYLIGENNTWIMNEFVVPIEIIKFPGKPAPGSTPTPRINTIAIYIDQANIGAGEIWCTSVDWAALSFDAIAPVVLIHGNNSRGEFWSDRGFTDELNTKNILFDNSINLPTDFIARNSIRLKSAIQERSDRFGAKRLHIVAHSKGGLDTRDYLTKYYNPDNFRIVSFTTLSTPHRGSAGADLIRDMENMNLLIIDLADLSSLENILAWILDYDDGTKNLTTSFCESFNQRNTPLLPNGIIYQAISADADISNNRSMERNEYIEMIEESEQLQGIDNASIPIVIAGFPISIPVGQAGVDILMQTMYDFLGTFKSTDLVTTEILGIPVYQRIDKTPASSFQSNDLMVTVNNAKISPFTEIASVKKNHASVADGEVAGIVINYIKPLK